MTKTPATCLLVFTALMFAHAPGFAVELRVETRLSTPQTVEANQTATAAAECDGDEIVVGGGFKLRSTESQAGLGLIRSEPIGETIWEIEVANDRGGGPQDFVVIARCLRPDSAALDDDEKCCSLQKSKMR